MKDGVGAAFTITPPYVLPHMGSWLPSGTVFPPQPAPAMLDYQPRSRRRTTARAGRRVRPERHNPQSIATLRIAIARQLLEQLPHCPFCGAKSTG
jgi:hypothetical protein